VESLLYFLEAVTVLSPSSSTHSVLFFKVLKIMGYVYKSKLFTAFIFSWFGPECLCPPAPGDFSPSRAKFCLPGLVFWSPGSFETVPGVKIIVPDEI
jgi:hypothetical protein